MPEKIKSFHEHPNFEHYAVIDKRHHDQHLFLFENEAQVSVITINHNPGFELLVRDWEGEINLTDEIFDVDDMVIPNLTEEEVLKHLEVVKNWRMSDD